MRPPAQIEPWLSTQDRDPIFEHYEVIGRDRSSRGRYPPPAAPKLILPHWEIAT